MGYGHVPSYLSVLCCIGPIQYAARSATCIRPQPLTRNKCDGVKTHTTDTGCVLCYSTPHSCYNAGHGTYHSRAKPARSGQQSERGHVTALRPLPATESRISIPTSSPAHETAHEPAHMAKPHNTSLLATPQRASGSIRREMTENSNGTALISEYLGDVTVDSVSPALFEDIRDHDTCDVKTTLKAFLALCLPEKQRKELQEEGKLEDFLQRCLKAVLPICNGKTPNGSKLRYHLGEYIAVISDERNRYRPFVFAFNRAFKDLEAIKCDPLPPFKSDLEILFHRNDPMPIKAEHNERTSYRKPDVVLVTLDAAQAAFSEPPSTGSWSEFAFDIAGESPACNFGWDKVLNSAEFKLEAGEELSLPKIYRINNSPLSIDPQRIPGSAKGPDEVETDPTGEAKKLQPPKKTTPESPAQGSSKKTKKPRLSGPQASLKGSARDSGEPSASSPRKSTRLSKKRESNVPATEAESSGLGKRKRKSREGSQETPPPQAAAAPSNTATGQGFRVSSLLAAEALGGKEGKREWQLGSSGEVDAPSAKAEGKRKEEATPAHEGAIPKRILMVQSASYAVERMSSAFWVTHVINLVIINNVAYIWYYDTRNWGVMEGFKKFKTKEGRVPSSNEEISLHFDIPLPGLPTSLELRLNLMQQHKIRGHYGLRGRCTQVFETTSSSADPRNREETLEGVGMVTKVSWPQKSRVPEGEMIEMARKVGAGNSCIEGHLPDLIFTRDFDQYSTKHIRTLLGLETEGERVPRMVVFRRLYPITDLVGEEFLKAFWECFRCHLHLWKGGIRHSDISSSNLMYNTATKRGILNDFDLAQLRDRSCPSGTERTDTMLFMALDLLQRAAWNGRVKREYHHDAESFAWVLLWICCTYEDGKKLPKPPLQALIQHTPGAVYEKKMSLRYHMEGPDFKVTSTTSYGEKYFQAAFQILAEYRRRHDTTKPHNPSQANTEGNGVEPDFPESPLTDLEAIKTELQVFRNILMSVGLDVDIYLPAVESLLS
ncbi:hypothetical protein BD779DRAFT_1557532 [Infundibulicybe gibba]|nr:hypothetical protein BD779DRAFT_1557532 [Infundibulicybe gibba]